MTVNLRDQSSISSTTDGHTSPRTLTVSAQRTGLVGIPLDHPTAPQTITFTIPNKRTSPSPRYFLGTTAGLGLLDFTSVDGELRLDEQCAPTQSTELPDFASDIDTSGSEMNWAPFIKEAVTTGLPRLVDVPSQTMVGMDKRGWGEHARQALVVPIIAGTGGVDIGGYGLGTCKSVLILGVNSRRPYDSDYEGWIGELGFLNCGALCVG